MDFQVATNQEGAIVYLRIEAETPEEARVALETLKKFSSPTIGNRLGEGILNQLAVSVPISGAGMQMNAFAQILHDLRDGKRIPVIKMVREVYGIGLKEAKDFVDGHWGPPEPSWGGPTAPLQNPVNVDSEPNDLDPPFPVRMSQVLALIEAVSLGKKIAAIKALREMFGLDLREAKDLVCAKMGEGSSW